MNVTQPLQTFQSLLISNFFSIIFLWKKSTEIFFSQCTLDSMCSSFKSNKLKNGKHRKEHPEPNLIENDTLTRLIWNENQLLVSKRRGKLVVSGLRGKKITLLFNITCWILTTNVLHIKVAPLMFPSADQERTVFPKNIKFITYNEITNVKKVRHQKL